MLRSVMRTSESPAPDASRCAIPGLNSSARTSAVCFSRLASNGSLPSARLPPPPHRHTAKPPPHEGRGTGERTHARVRDRHARPHVCARIERVALRARALPRSAQAPPLTAWATASEGERNARTCGAAGSGREAAVGDGPVR